jgi:hypothetical protein
MEQGVQATVRKVALAIDQTVVMGTPVDTGRARSNWMVTVGAPSDAVISAYAPGEGGNTAASNTAAALEQGAAVIAGYAGGSSIHLTNNLPYIARLNDGYSAQAPAGFVEKSVQVAAGVVAGAKVLDGGV